MNSTSLPKIQHFFNNYPVRRYKKGQILLLSDETTEYGFYLTSGQVKIYDISSKGDEVTIDHFKSPMFFPVSLIINEARSLYIYEAATDIALRRAPRQDVVKFLDGNPDVVYDLLRQLYVALDGIFKRMVHMVSSSAITRVMYSLVEECEIFGKADSKGTYSLQITEREIGARCGLTRETVSREAKRLKADHLIEVGRKYIKILDLAKLKRASAS